MDSAFKLILLILVSLAFALQSQNSYSYQNLAIAAGEPDFFRSPVTNFNSARFSANDPIYDPATRTVTTTRPYNVTGLDGKTYQATITKTAAADIAKVGMALSKFAQRVGPLAMAAATATLICDLASICANAAEWALNKIGFPSGSGSYPSCEEAIGLAAGSNFPQCTTISNAHSNVFWFRSPSSPPSSANCTNVGGTSWTYTALAYTCTNPPSTSEPLAPNDWTNAETALSTPAGADRLAAELEPLPIKAPSVFAPISVPLGTSTATNKDPAGNATGTQTTTRRMDIEDAATEAEPYRVTVKETSTVTNYDLNNSPISSTETVSQSDTPAEPPPPEDIEIDFDESVDRDLQTFEVPGLFSYTPFGGAGSCPQDVTENTKFGNVTMSYAPVCEVAEGVKPFVILLAIISAFFIVSGSRQS